MRNRLKWALLGFALIPGSALAQLGTLPAVPLNPPANAPWFNTSLPITQRVDALVSQMTLDEKASQLVNISNAIPRLGVPGYNWWSEALHGTVLPGATTVYPEPIGLGATFDPALVHDMATAISIEGRVNYNRERREGLYAGLDFWAPNINIFRDPRWGRGQETYGEDPFLTAQFGVAYVTGMQGNDPDHPRAIATPKHYAVHSGPEPTRHMMDVTASKHDMIDTYTPAFRAAVVDAKAGSVMCAYNRVNGVPACANDFLLNDLLRNAWQFKGYVTSDCGAITDIHQGHHYTKNMVEAAAVSMKHGVDTDCSNFNEGPSDAKAYASAVSQGLMSEAVMDQSLNRLFTARMRLGMFDPPESSPYYNIPDSALDSPAHRALALRAARESMVLLKNNGVLPLKKAAKKILVVGPLADQVQVLLGNYNGEPSHGVSALEGIKAAFPGSKVRYEAGTDFLNLPETVPASALKTPDGKPGVKAEYFTSPTLSGTPLVSKIETQLDFDFHNLTLIGLQKNAAIKSAAFTGTVTPDQDGVYEIGLASPFTNLWLDGKLIVTDMDIVGPPKTVRMTLQKGHAYSFRITETPSLGLPPRFVWRHVMANPQADAVAAAKDADVVVAVVGITSMLEGEEMNVNIPGFKGGDRTSLDLPKEEEDLLKAMKATGKKLVVVLMNGSALSVNWAAKNADAIVEAWYSGEEGGTAIGQTLSGLNNPSGHLPVTFYKGVDQLPAFEDYSMANRTYRYFTGTPLYPFGYGLSYTNFRYSGLKVASTVKAGDQLGVDAVVTNTGKQAGDAVAQLYLNFPNVPGVPLRALRGVSRVTLKPGESRKVHFELSPRDLSSVTPNGDRVVAIGDYKISVGGGQPIAGTAFTQGAFHVTGTTVTLPQ